MELSAPVQRSSAFATVLIVIASVLIGMAWAVASPSASPARANDVCTPSPIWAQSRTNELIKYAADGTELSRVQMTLQVDASFYLLGDIAWSADGLTMYGSVSFAGGTQGLFVIDPETGTATRSIDLPAGPGNALAPAADGRLYVPSSTELLIVDPVSGESEVVAPLPTGYRSAGDFLTLADGDILAVLTQLGAPVSTLFRIHPDGSSTQIGTVPSTYGAAQSGGKIYLAGADGELRLLDQVPTADTGSIATTTVVTNGTSLYGATSLEDAGCVVASSKSALASSDPVIAGTAVTYTLRLTNNTSSPTNVERTDILDAVLDDADWTSGPIVSNQGVSAVLSGTQLDITGQLAAGDTVTVTYSVTVKPDGQRGDDILSNYLVTTGEAPPNTCAADNANCTTNVVTPMPVSAMSASKSVDPASGAQVTAGEVLTYTLAFQNSGSGVGVVDYTDLLADVVDDAEVTTVPVSSDPGLTVTDGADGTIAVTGTLNGGQTATVTYAVTVKPDGQRGNDSLSNYLVHAGAAAPAACAVGSATCTTNPVAVIVDNTPQPDAEPIDTDARPAGDLADTGGQIGTGLALAATALLGAGTLILLLRRRARVHS